VEFLDLAVQLADLVLDAGQTRNPGLLGKLHLLFLLATQDAKRGKAERKAPLRCTVLGVYRRGCHKQRCKRAAEDSSKMHEPLASELKPWMGQGRGKPLAGGPAAPASSRARDFGQILLMAAQQKRQHCGCLFWMRETLPSGGQSASGACQRRDGTAVLRPTGNVVANGDRTFLAVGDRLDAVGSHTQRSQIVAGGGGAPGTEREVVFARAAFVRMTFDDDLVLRVLVEPLRLTGQCLLRVCADRRRVGVEEDAVADIDGEVLCGPWRRGTGAKAKIGGAVGCLLRGAAGQR